MLATRINVISRFSSACWIHYTVNEIQHNFLENQTKKRSVHNSPPRFKEGRHQHRNCLQILYEWSWINQSIHEVSSFLWYAFWRNLISNLEDVWFSILLIAFSASSISKWFFSSPLRFWIHFIRWHDLLLDWTETRETKKRYETCKSRSSLHVYSECDKP